MAKYDIGSYGSYFWYSTAIRLNVGCFTGTGGTSFVWPTDTWTRTHYVGFTLANSF